MSVRRRQSVINEALEAARRRACRHGKGETSQKPVWLTVTDAGQFLLDVGSGINLKKARARISKAADAGKFRTNGKKGRYRRIEQDSFNTWRFEQRDRDMAGVDEWANMEA